MLNLLKYIIVILTKVRQKMVEDKPANNPRTIHDGWQPVEKGYQPTSRPDQQNNGYQPPRQTQQTQHIAPPPKKR
ncbi:hypothetical protein from bacteriophage origin [Escherichia coli UMN026]|uniref:Uncharacterized protein n=2 Tax=Enterobacterales TaxID=91347 RepID=B7NAF3_ECOLU|nr:hypothetical protein CUC50_04620 [Citrobacter werkmanii]EEW4980158.1 hypothetical protein [Escherichia coli]PCQ49357.1 hypothetical protein CQA31_03380 [Citrobacter freundii]CAR12206.1 hypothetical protein from bacteriophage origin [Escherichia coli UMN026]EFF2127425.1 hypothetical protein [Escherichia coli]